MYLYLETFYDYFNQRVNHIQLRLLIKCVLSNNVFKTSNDIVCVLKIQVEH